MPLSNPQIEEAPKDADIAAVFSDGVPIVVTTPSILSNDRYSEMGYPNPPAGFLLEKAGADGYLTLHVTPKLQDGKFTGVSEYTIGNVSPAILGSGILTTVRRLFEKGILPLEPADLSVRIAHDESHPNRVTATLDLKRSLSPETYARAEQEDAMYGSLQARIYPRAIKDGYRNISECWYQMIGKEMLDIYHAAGMKEIERQLSDLRRPDLVENAKQAYKKSEEESLGEWLEAQGGAAAKNREKITGASRQASEKAVAQWWESNGSTLLAGYKSIVEPNDKGQITVANANACPNPSATIPSPQTPSPPPASTAPPSWMPQEGTTPQTSKPHAAGKSSNRR